MHAASEGGHVATIQLLVSNGARIDVKDKVLYSQFTNIDLKIILSAVRCNCIIYIANCQKIIHFSRKHDVYYSHL